MNYPLNSMTLPGKPGKVECWDAANVNCTIYNDTTVQACKKRKGVGCSQCHYGCVNNSQAEIDDMVNYDKILRMNVGAQILRGFRLHAIYPCFMRRFDL